MSFGTAGRWDTPLGESGLGSSSRSASPWVLRLPGAPGGTLWPPGLDRGRGRKLLEALEATATAHISLSPLLSQVMRTFSNNQTL